MQKMDPKFLQLNLIHNLKKNSNSNFRDHGDFHFSNEIDII